MKFTRKFVVGSVVGILAGAALGAAGVTQFNQRVVTVDGASATPAYSFISDNDTGILRTSSGTLGVSSNGTTVGTFSGSNFTIPDGTVGTAGLGFLSDPDTGIYRGGVNDIAITAGGVNTVGLGTYGVRSRDAGDQSTPAYAFINDPDTGIYRSGANEVAFTTSGTRRGVFYDSGLIVDGGLAVGASANGSFKVKIFTGSFSGITNGSTVATLTSPGTTLAVSGMWQAATSPSSGNYYPIAMYASSVTGTLQFQGAGGENVLINNQSGSTVTGTYRVVMFYQ